MVGRVCGRVCGREGVVGRVCDSHNISTNSYGYTEKRRKEERVCVCEEVIDQSMDQ